MQVRGARQAAKVAASTVLAVSVAVASEFGAQNESQPDWRNPDLPFEARAADLVSRMTMEEKVSQLMHESAPIPRLGIPAYNWWNECLHGVARAGVATVYPQAIGMAASFD